MRDFKLLKTLSYEFYDYMGREKKPGNGRIELWIQKLNGCTSNEVQEAFEWMKDNVDNIPYNFPKAIKNAVFMVNKGKPVPSIKFTQHMYGHCDDCEGMGIFKILYYDQFKNRSEPILYCSRCENWKHWTNSPGDRISKAELEAAGYTFKSYNQVLVKAEDVKTKGNSADIKNLAFSFGESKRLNEDKKYKNRYIKHEEK